MAEWSDTTKHPASSFNAGNQYTKNDQMSLEALNNNIENALYAARVAENAQSATNNAVSYNAQTPLATEQKQAQKNLGIDQTISFAETERQKSKNLFYENKYLSSYCTYASNKWTTNSTRIGYNQSILTNEVSSTGNRNTSKLPLLKKGTCTLTMFNVVNNTNDTSINIAFYNQDGTINGTPITATIVINTTITFTLASDLYLDIRVQGDTGTISFDHIQVEQGTKSTDYQPYYGAIAHQGDIITPTVLYDKDSSYPNLNWGYTSGIMTDGKGTLSIPVNFSPYKTIIFYARLNHMSAIGYYSVSTANNQFSILAADIYSARAETNYFSGYIYNKIDLRPTFSGRGNTAKDNNTEYYIYRIEGIK